MAYTQIVCLYCSWGQVLSEYFPLEPRVTMRKAGVHYTVVLCDKATRERPCMGIQGL